jgi:hypothetical protein
MSVLGMHNAYIIYNGVERCLNIVYYRCNDNNEQWRKKMLTETAILEYLATRKLKALSDVEICRDVARVIIKDDSRDVAEMYICIDDSGRVYGEY